MKKRIICVGNPFVEVDGAGPRVHDCLARGMMPEAVDLVEGGLAGLDLLPLVEGCDRVVFVDGVNGFAAHPGVVVLGAEEAARCADRVYDHQAGLGYLLRVLPLVLEDALPEIFLVGIEGAPDEERVAEAARQSLQLALHGEGGGKTMKREVTEKEA